MLYQRLTPQAHCTDTTPSYIVMEQIGDELVASGLFASSGMAMFATILVERK